MFGEKKIKHFMDQLIKFLPNFYQILLKYALLVVITFIFTTEKNNASILECNMCPLTMETILNNFGTKQPKLWAI